MARAKLGDCTFYGVAPGSKLRLFHETSSTHVAAYQAQARSALRVLKTIYRLRVLRATVLYSIADCGSRKLLWIVGLQNYSARLLQSASALLLDS